MDVLLLKSDDWIVCYIDNKLISQAHSFDILFLLKQSEIYGFKYSDVRELYLEEIDFECIDIQGFPMNLLELKGNYSLK